MTEQVAGQQNRRAQPSQTRDVSQSDDKGHGNNSADYWNNRFLQSLNANDYRNAAPRTGADGLPPVSLEGGAQVRQTGPHEQELTINAGNRTGKVRVLLPDDYDPNNAQKRYPVVVAVHNFAGDNQEFAGMINAERLRKAGAIVVLPQAEASPLPVREWQGNQIDYFGTRRGDNGKPVDDPAFVSDTARYVMDHYHGDRTDLLLAGFSQGQSVAYAAAQNLDASGYHVRAVIASAGSMSRPSNLPGTDVVQYLPGHNLMQWFGNVLNGGPSADAYTADLIRQKACTPNGSSNGAGVNTQFYSCRDGSRISVIREPRGEHTWPGSPRQYDSFLTGEGSHSAVQLTEAVMLEMVSAPGYLAQNRSPEERYQDAQRRRQASGKAAGT